MDSCLSLGTVVWKGSGNPPHYSFLTQVTIKTDIKVSTMNRTKSFEMWHYHRILKVLKNIVKHCKLEYFGHIVSGSKCQLLCVIIQGKIECKCWIGDKKLSWLCNLWQWAGLSVEELFSTASDRIQYHSLAKGWSPTPN